MINRIRKIKTLRWMMRIVLVAAMILGIFIAFRVSQGNFGTVRPGEIYRSGQMSASAIGAKIREHNIRTVINLRGPNPDTNWYKKERSAVSAAGATLIDIPLSSCDWMSRSQLLLLQTMVATAPRPVLIHCQRGAERTGIALALEALSRPGSTLADADAVFSPYYLFVRAGDGKTTIEHLDLYKEWLKVNGAAHSPDRLLEWIRYGYRPGPSSREFWPYDPYPLFVLTPPAGAQTSAKTSAHETKVGVDVRDETERVIRK